MLFFFCHKHPTQSSPDREQIVLHIHFRSYCKYCDASLLFIDSNIFILNTLFLSLTLLDVFQTVEMKCNMFIFIIRDQL